MSRLPNVAQSQRQPYPSDLSDAEWAILAPLLPALKGFGYPRTIERWATMPRPNPPIYAP